MSRGSARRRSGATTVSIPIQSTTVGSVAANAFTGWTNLAGGAVTLSTGYGVTARYLHANTENTVFARTTAVSFDQEVTFWASRGVVYLRLTDAGAALALAVNSDGSWYTLYVPSVATGTFFDTGTNVLMSSGLPSGINMSDTDGDEWTFGVSGFEMYVKWNGVEQWRGKQIYHHQPGRVGLRTFATGTTFGFRSVSVEHKLTSAITSSPIENTIDVRDFGLKSLTATGSMSAASTTLTLTSNPGFAIGDPIIVVIGGEAGAGEPGTRGVGGQWPTLTYADNAAMTADTGQVVNKIAARLDNGLTYQWNGSAWVAYNIANFGQTASWHYRMMPKSLVTTITNVSGTTLTLAHASTVATTAATVVYNSAIQYLQILGYNYTGAGIDTYVNNKTVLWPAGTWSFSQDSGLVGGVSNWNVLGAGRDSTTIVSPMGVTGLRVSPENRSNVTFSGITFKGNRRGDKGWLFFYNPTTDVPLQLSTSAFNPNTSSNVAVTGCRFTTMEATLATCTDSYFDDIEANWEVGQRAYGGWQVQLANSTNTYGRNIVIDNDQTIPALEIFGSGNDCYFEDVTITNGLIAVNTADNWRMSRINVTIETNSSNDADYNHVIANQSLLNINCNIDPINRSGPGLFEDFNFDIGYSNAANYLFQGIGISGVLDNVTIRGKYPDKPNSYGLITLPSGWSSSQEKGIGSEGTNPTGTRIEGVRITPTNSGSGGDIFLYTPGSTIIDCVVDDIRTDQTSTNNITNAAYDAL